jgi:hypothetical protein
MKSARATITIPAAGRLPAKTVTLSVERTAFFRGYGAAIGAGTVQEAFLRYPWNQLRVPQS